MLQPRLSPRESPPTCCGRGRSGVCAGIAIVGIVLSSSALRSTFTLRILQSRSALTTCCARARRDGIFDGRLIGINCRGAEKVARLEKLIGGFDGHQIFAYGDSDGDREMLRVADFPFYRPFRRSDDLSSAGMGWPRWPDCNRPARPAFGDQPSAYGAVRPQAAG